MKNKSQLKGDLTYFKQNKKQATGIEPASSAWEADILPMYYACKSKKYYLIVRATYFYLNKQKTVTYRSTIICDDYFILVNIWYNFK